MTKITVLFNGLPVEAELGQTILEAARSHGIKIPTLCHMENLVPSGSCRICVVEVEGERNLVPSCAFPVRDGMAVYTHSERVRRARKSIVELLLANHPDECLYCLRNGDCELQKLAMDFGIRERRFTGNKSHYHIDSSSIAIERDPNKCVLCGRCVRVCDEIQGVGAIDFVGRGLDSVVLPPFNADLADSDCVFCGQCVLACPTGALREKSALRTVWSAILNSKKKVIAQIAPAVRVSVAEELGLEPGTDITGKIIAGLRLLGFDKVFDTNFTADVTVMEEANELVERIKNGGTLPLMSSCSPAWIKFVERNYPEMLPHLSSCKSPQQMFGAIAKTYYAEQQGWQPEDVFVVSIMPCTAKKFEATRPEMGRDGYRDVDAVLTTRELLRMLSTASVEVMRLADGEFDHPLGESSGAAVIFGTTGGVAEAALRTAVYLITGKDAEKVDFNMVRGFKGIKEAEVKIGDLTLKCAVVNGLSNARIVLDGLRDGSLNYDFVEVMSCPGGCVGGGGQPAKDRSNIQARAQALYIIDAVKSVRTAHHNPEVKELYKNFLGKPLGELSHKLLHTKYVPRYPKELNVASTKD